MDSAAAPVPYIRARLFVMMLLEFFIWGAWLPLIFGYLGPNGLNFSPWEQSLILNAFPAAAIVGMFFSSQFADRNFSGERFLAFSHLVGGLAMIGIGFSKSFGAIFSLMLLHCLLYVPTISITNSVAFANLKDPQKDFGLVRMGGTIGWILAAWPFTFIFVDWAKVEAAHPVGAVAWLRTALGSTLSGSAAVEMTRWTYFVAGAGSLLLCLFSLTLPHTPPKKATGGAVEKFAWLEAVKLLRHPFVLVLWLIAFFDSFVHNCYFSWTGTFLGTVAKDGGPGIAPNWIMPVMSLSQISEILTMAILGMVLKNLGWRGTMVIGILGHAARFAVYSFLPQETWLIILIQAVHGICYAFFFATVYIFVDAFFPKDVRSSAQGLFNVMILGVGALAAYSICPVLAQKVFIVAGKTNYRALFMFPCLTALVAAIILGIFFRPPKAAEEPGAPAMEAQGGSA
jgi:nucleoside transporter